MNIESLIVKFLKEKLTVPVSADIPAKRPPSFITLERTGGAIRANLDYPVIAIQCWAHSRLEASNLAYRTRSVVRGLAQDSGVVAVNVGGVYNWPDPDSGHARYQLIVELVTYVND